MCRKMAHHRKYSLNAINIHYKDFSISTWRYDVVIREQSGNPLCGYSHHLFSEPGCGRHRKDIPNSDVRTHSTAPSQQLG